MGLADYWKSGAFEEEETGAIPEPAAPVQNSGFGDYWKGLSNQPAAPESPPAQQTGIEMPSPLVSKPTGIVPPKLTESKPTGITPPSLTAAQPSGIGELWKNMPAPGGELEPLSPLADVSGGMPQTPVNPDIGILEFLHEAWKRKSKIAVGGAATVAKALRRGDEDINVDSALDIFIRGAKNYNEQYLKLSESERKRKLVHIPFTKDTDITLGDLDDAMVSAGYSVVGMFVQKLSGLAGGAAGTAVAGPVGTLPGKYAGEVTGGLTFMTSASYDDFLQQHQDKYKQANKGLTPRQLQKGWEQTYDTLKGDAFIYGLAEAVPEVAGNMIMWGIGKAGKSGLTKLGLDKLKDKFAKGAISKLALKIGVPVAKLASMNAEEIGTETITQYIQGGREAATGLRGKAPSVKEAFLEILPQTLLLSTGQGGAVMAAQKGLEVVSGKPPTDLLTDKKIPPKSPDTVSGRADANQILEGAAANAEAHAQAGAIPEGPIAQTEQPGTPPGVAQMTPEDILIAAEERRAIEAQAGEVLAPSAARLTPEQELMRQGQPAQIGVTSEQPSPIYDAKMVEPERVYQAIPEFQPKQYGVTSEQPTAVKAKKDTTGKAKPLTAEEMADLPLSELAKIPVAERARAISGEGAAEEAVARLAGEAEKVIEKSKGPKLKADLEAAAEETDPSPTKAEIKADSYDQGELKWNGFKIAIETAKGMIRTGVDKLGKKWSQKMNVDYGKIKGVMGADGEDLDIAFRRSDNPKDYDNVYVIDQLDPNTGEFDEHKVYVGYAGAKQAELGYKANYEKGWKGFGGVTVMSKGAFKGFLKRMDPKVPAAGQEKITREEWLSSPEMRPAKYDKAEYRPGATGKVEKIVNATIEKEYETWLEKQSAKEPQVKEKEAIEAKKEMLIRRVTNLLKPHRKKLKIGDLKEVDAGETPLVVRPQFVLVKKLAETIGIKMIIIDSGDVDIAMNGVWIPKLKTIVLNVKNKYPIATVFTHETIHSMEKLNPVLYKELSDYVFKNTTDDSFLKWSQKYIEDLNSVADQTDTERKIPSEKTLISEFVAYSASSASTQKSFWETMAKENPGLFDKIAKFIYETIQRVMNLTGIPAKYSKEIKFKNLEQASIDIAKIFARYAEEKKIPLDIFDFSKAAGDLADVEMVASVPNFKDEDDFIDHWYKKQIRKQRAVGMSVAKKLNGKYRRKVRVPDKLAPYIGDFGSEISVDGNKIYFIASSENQTIYIPNLAIADTGSGLGKKFMEGLREFADETSQNIVVYKVTNKKFFNKFDWLKEKDGDFKYQSTMDNFVGVSQLRDIFTGESGVLADIEVLEKDDSNTIAMNAISGLADGKTTIALTKDNVGARPIIESLGFVRQGKSNNYKFDERVPKDADIIAGMYQAAWHVDLKTKGTTKELFGQVSKRLGRIQREGLGEAEQSEDQKKFRNYLNESWLTYREAADATARGNQLPTKNVLVRPKSVESGRGRQLTVQIASDFRAEEASHIGDPYYEAIYNNREGYARPSRDFWEVPEWMTRLAYFMPKADVYVIRNLEEAIAFFNESNYDQIFFSVLDTNKRFVKHIAENYDGDIIAGGYLPDGSYYKGMKNVSWMANMEEAAKKVGVPFKNGVDYRHFEGTRTIPRLELSRGCLHKCAFCSQERTLKLATPAEIDNQINEFKSFDYDIVYLNDKTFGQAANYEQLIGVKEKIKKANPKFKGFVIQTTAGQYLKMSDQFLKDSGIIYVELGVETFNDKFLKSLHKPHTTALIEKATEKIRRLNQIFVPNVMVGLTGKNKDGTRWVENKDTYANTLDFFKRNRDIISHFNIGVLAAETGTELQKQLDDWQEVDTDEATMNRSWIKNKDVHEKYYYDLSQFGIEQLESKKVADYVAQAIKASQKEKPVSAPMIVGLGRALFDIELEKTPKAKKIPEGGKGSATGSLLYNEITEIAKAAGGWAKIGAYLDTIDTWKGIPVSKDAVRFIGNTGSKLAKDVKLRNKVKSIESFRKRLAAGEIDENSPEYKKAHEKYGSELKLRTVPHQKRFHVGVNTIYGPKQEGDITKTIKKEHPIFGEFTTEITRDKDFNLVMDTPIFSNNYDTRQKEIDEIIKENKKYVGWYDEWNSFIKSFKHLPEAKLIKYIKMMAVFSAGSGPQGNMKLFTMAANKLESGQALVSGSLVEGGDGVSKADVPKIMAIWNDADPATTLEERRDIYGPKVGTYMHIGLFPHADAIVIDRHMPRPWGYDITWSPNMKHKGFDVRPEVEAEIVRDIKSAAKRNNISTSAVQAAIWYKSRTPDVEASTYQEAAAMSPSEYLPGVMHAALRPESLGVGKHFKTTPLKKGEFILATKRDGSIEYNAYSRDDIGNRIYGHTDKNPYAELVYLYEASTIPEQQLKGKKNVYTVDLDRQRIYDGVDDIMGYWGFAAERLKLDPFANLTNIFSNLVEATEMFDGFVINSPYGTGRWVLMFKKAEITGVPEDIVAGMSDVVESLETEFPQTIRGISAIFKGRSDKLYDKFKKLRSRYDEIREESFKPTVARFQGATGGKHEISGMASVRGPLKAARAMMAEFGIANIQNNVILVHTEEGAERNGNFYRFKVKRDFKNIEDIYEKIASYGLEDYNISVTPLSGSFFIEQFVMDSYPESFVDSFSKMIDEISDKGFPQNITYRATSEVLGDPKWSGRPAKALKHYRKNLTDYFGEKEGNQKYAKAIKEAQAYKEEIGKRGAAGEALFDVDFTEDTGERVKQDYGRPVEGQDIEGQFERPGEPLFDIEAAEPGETRADLWYSQLQAMVESKSFPMKSSPKQMISVLEGMARKGQIKQTELDWAGLVDWLDYIKGPVTKAQVLEFLDKNNVKLEEKILGGDPQESEEGRRLIADTMLDGFDPTSPNWGILEDELATWVIKGGDIENYQTIQDLWDDTDSTSAIRTDSDRQKIYNWVGRMGLNQWIDYRFSPEDTGVEYGQYTIDEEGSPEYREILISMERQDVVDGALEALDWYENKVPDAFPAMTKGMSEQDQMRYKMSKLGKLSLWQLQESGAPEYLVKNFKKWQNAVDFKIPHWREKPVSDVVAHLRTDVKEIGGKRTLFIEEIQSDWAQRGRKVGYIDLSKAAPVGYHIVSQLQPDKTYVVKQLYEDSTGKLLAEASMINEALEKAGFNPNAFVKQTPFMLSKSWALLVLKRAVRYAAEHGFDQIAWTGGQIQVERYEEAFRKRVDLIIYNRKTGLIRAFYDKQEVYQKSLKSDDEVSEYIGDANAKSILSGEMYKEGMTSIPKSNINPGYYNLEDGDSVLEGNNIIIDEDGMKGFYDEIVPSTFKRFFSKKKWGSPELKQEDIVVGDFLKVNYIPSHLVPGRGGVELESAKFQIYENGEWNTYSTTDAVKGYIDSEKLYSTPLHGDIMGFRIKDAITLWAYEEKVPDGFSTIEEFIKIIVQPALNSHFGAMEEKRPIWVSPITEKMRSSAIEEGFPMFDIEEADIPKESGAVLKDKIGRKEKTLSTKIATSVKEFGENWQTYMLDKLHPIADWFGNDSGAYMTHRGLPGVQSTLNAFMEQGKLKMLDDGSITTEESGKGFLKWLSGLGQDAEKFLYWQIAKRSEVLTGEDRELLLTDSDRQKIYNWVGEKPKSRDSWQEISDEFAEWNQNMLDLAIKSGLLSKEQIDTWQSDFYIPFYRIFEDEQARMEFVRGPAKGRKYISAQVKRLRGSESRMGDPMENIIKNWSALLGNSMFNIARKETFEFANKNNIMSGMTRINEDTGAEEQIPVLEQIPWAQTVIFKQIKGGMTFVQEKTGDPVLAFKDGGKSVFFKVNDPELFNALSGVNKAYFDNVLMKVMSGSKRLLTLGATITPAFRIANMLRDTLHTFQISDNFIPFWDTARGFMKIWKNDPEYAQFMASGHAFGGSYVRAEDPRAMKRYTDRIVKREGKGALKRVLDTAEKLWGFWEDVGEASENAARIQLYSNLKKKGKTHMQAAFAARDLMDFQMSGASNVVQFFIQTIPFLNARMQGLYRMGRAAALDPKSFLIKGSLIATASLALWLLYWDDDRYKELEDWEKFAYYHFWIGGVHFRIPKPFETGVVFSSSVEAAANVMSGNDEISHVFNYLKHAFLETFAFNPVPQVIRPAAEIYMNKSFFTGREIESQSKKRLRPGDRYDPWDSETLRLLGEGLNISPKKAEAIIRGYTASLGMGILAASDLMVRNIADFPERPSKDIGDYPAIGRFVKGKVSRYTKHMSKFYDLYNEVDELVATVNNYKRIGEFEKARELAKANRKLLSLRSGLGDARKELGDISLEIRKVWFSKKLTSDQKRDRLLVLTERRNNIVRKVYDRYLNK